MLAGQSRKRSWEQLEGEGLGRMKLQGLKMATETNGAMKMHHCMWLLPILTTVYR